MPGFVKIKNFRRLSEAGKSQASCFSASVRGSASLASYWHNLNSVRVKRFLSHSKILVFGRQRRGLGFSLCLLVPCQTYSLSHV